MDTGRRQSNVTSIMSSVSRTTFGSTDEDSERPSRHLSEPEECNSVDLKRFYSSWEAGLIASEETFSGGRYQTWPELLQELITACSLIERDLGQTTRFQASFTKIKAIVKTIALYTGVPIGAYPAAIECAPVSLRFHKMISILARIGIFNDIVACDSETRNTIYSPEAFHDLLLSFQIAVHKFYTTFKEIYTPSDSQSGEKNLNLPTISNLFQVRHYSENRFRDACIDLEGHIKLYHTAQNQAFPLEKFDSSLTLTPELQDAFEDQERFILNMAGGLRQTINEFPDDMRQLALHLRLIRDRLHTLTEYVECLDLGIFYSCPVNPYSVNSQHSTVKHLYELLSIKPHLYEIICDFTLVVKNIDRVTDQSLKKSSSTHTEQLKLERVIRRAKISTKATLNSSLLMLVSTLKDLSVVINSLADEEGALLSVSRMVTDSSEGSRKLTDSMGVLENFHDTYIEPTSDLASDIFMTLEAERSLSSGDEPSIHRTRTSQPWYLDFEYPDEVVYSKEGNRRGATLRAIVEQISLPLENNETYSAAILLTFQSFSSAWDFYQHLRLRFWLEPSKDLSADELAIWKRKKRDPVRKKVVHLLTLWLQKYWTQDDIYISLKRASQASEETIEKARRKLLLAMKDFSAEIRKSGHGTSSLLEIIERRLDKVEPFVLQQEHHFQVLRDQGTIPVSPSPILPKNVKKFRLSEIGPVEMARQLCLRESRLFLAISPYECLKRACKKMTFSLNPETVMHPEYTLDSGTAMYITELIANSNHLTNFVGHAILRHSQSKRRAQTIRYFVEVADHLRKMQNFSSMTAIISALFSSTIHRMRKTWGHLSPDHAQKLEEMNRLMSSTRNFNDYRQLLRTISAPSVPFFGVILSDLTFIEQGNPDFLDKEHRIINTGKLSKAAFVIEGVRRLQTCPYSFEEVPDIQLFLDFSFSQAPSIEQQYETSLAYEPRTQKQSKESKNQGDISDQFAKNLALNGIL